MCPLYHYTHINVVVVDLFIVGFVVVAVAIGGILVAQPTSIGIYGIREQLNYNRRT